MPSGIYKRTEENKKNLSKSHKGKKMSEESKRKQSERLKGKMPKNLGIYFTHKGCKHTKESKEKMREARLGKYNGEKHPNWQGGITPENSKIRQSLEFKLWHKSVFERDNFTCQKYGIRGGNLVAHHINNFAEKKELRFAIDNGVTLSEKAHKEFHKIYGFRNNTREQLDEFLYTT